jgi:hypothetical protein
MPEEALRHKLEDLRRELANQPSLDAATVQGLQELIDRMERTLGVGSSQVPSVSRESSEENLSDRISDWIVTLEARHPRLTLSLTQIADVLGEMGL